MTPTSPSLDSETKELRKAIDAELDRFLRSERGQLQILEPRSVEMVDDLSDLVLAGGKRIRPLLCCLAYEAAGGTSKAIVRLAGSLELLHVFALIHDDVMDGADIRRGKPTVSLSAMDRYRGSSSKDERDLGRAVAILTGDLAFVLSDRLYFESGMPGILNGVPYLTEMRLAAISGQFADLTHQGPPTRERAGQIARLKTAHYSISGPLQLGAVLAGAEESALDLLRGAGGALGEAFQLRNDLADAFEDPVTTGKEAAGDLRSAKPTLLLAEATARANDEDRDAIMQVVGRSDATEQQVQDALEAIVSSGAVGAVEERIANLSTEGMQMLDRASGLLDGNSERLVRLAKNLVE